MQQVKHTATSSWTEFEPALERVMKLTGASMNEIMMTIGYAGAGNIAKWRADGVVPRRAKYALVGYLSELEGGVVVTPTEAVFTFDELVAMFGVLSGWQIPADVQKALSRKIAKQVANGAG